jgi:hypothetical protein
LRPAAAAAAAVCLPAASEKARGLRPGPKGHLTHSCSSNIDSTHRQDIRCATACTGRPQVARCSKACCAAIERLKRPVLSAAPQVQGVIWHIVAAASFTTPTGLSRREGRCATAYTVDNVPHRGRRGERCLLTTKVALPTKPWLTFCTLHPP